MAFEEFDPPGDAEPTELEDRPRRQARERTTRPRTRGGGKSGTDEFTDIIWLVLGVLVVAAVARAVWPVIEPYADDPTGTLASLLGWLRDIAGDAVARFRG